VRDVIAPLAAREAEWRAALHDGTIETFVESYVESELPAFDDRITPHDDDRIGFACARPCDFAF
jgi:hypothetical protein